MGLASHPVIDIRNFVSTSYDALYNSFKWNLPPKLNLGEVLCDLHARENATALIYENDEGQSETFSYAELKSPKSR